MLNGRIPDHHYKESIKVLRRRARLTSDLVEIQLDYRRKLEIEKDNNRLKERYSRAYNFLTRQIRLSDKTFNSFFERPA
jgi:hypothetical protein